MSTTKIDEVKGTIAAILIVEPNDSAYKVIEAKSKIFKETFEEKAFYKEIKATGKGKSKVIERESEPLKSTKEDELSGTFSESAYIQIGDEQVSHIAFEDGSLYKVGKGFIKDGNEENKKFVAERLAEAKK